MLSPLNQYQKQLLKVSLLIIIYQVELGRDVNVVDQTTHKCYRIAKGSTIVIYAAVVEFERYFEFVMNEVVYRVLQTEIDDGVIKSTTAKPKP